jgi:phosphohistidine phosphatase
MPGTRVIWEAWRMASDSARRLILLRHAKSAWPDGVPDHDRPLAGRGRRDAPAAGRWLAGSGYVPDLVLCSTAQRARETWQLADAELGAHPQTTFEDRVYGAMAAELLDLAHEVPSSVRTLMLVGHDPAMRELTLELASPIQPDDVSTMALARVRLKFPTAAIAVLAFTSSWPTLRLETARLAEFVAPADIRVR